MVLVPEPKYDFTIIIPTYTGQEYINMCFQSIFDQIYDDKQKPIFEVIVVIDGPNTKLREIVDENKTKFDQQNIELKVHQFSHNQGRFEARLKGAELARSDQLLFVDDRVTLKADYISKLIGEQDVVIANVLEAEQRNILSRFLYLARRRIYGKDKWGNSFKAYYITTDNFEKSPKGTTSLWVKRDLFLFACNVMKKASDGKSMQHTNDDTAILRIIVDKTKQLLRRGDVIIYYHSRSKLLNEAEHIYQRGPRFVDYYFRPGSRYWKFILTSSIVVLLCILGIVFYGLIFAKVLLVAIIIATLLLAFTLAETAEDILIVPPSLILTCVLFGAGILVGLVGKLRQKLWN